MIILTMCGNSFGAEYYIAPNGNDSNPGTLTSPKRTLYAGASLLSGGDTLYCRGGTYTDSPATTFYSSRSGTASSPICIKNYPGETPVFDMIGSDQYIIYIRSGYRYWVIDGLHFKPSSGRPMVYGIIVLEGDHNAVQNCTFEGYKANNSSASNIDDSFIKVYRDTADYNTIQNNTFKNCGNPSGIGETGDCVTILDGDYNLVQNNSFSYCGHSSILIKAQFGNVPTYNQIKNNTITSHWGHGINLVQGTTSTDTNLYNLIEGNIITACAENLNYSKVCFAIYGNGNSFRKNVCYNNYSYGMQLQQRNQSIIGPCKNNLVYNNVFYGNYADGINLLIQDTAANLSGTIIANNVFAHNMVNLAYRHPGESWHEEIAVINYHSGTDMWGAYSNRVRNNFIQAYRSAWQNDYVDVYVEQRPNFAVTKKVSEMQATYYNCSGSSGCWSNNIYNVGDPKFVTPGNGNFQLQPGSPLVDAGIIVNDSVWGNLSYLGSAPDIGAYEYGGESPPPPSPPPPDGSAPSAPTGLKIIQ